MKIIVPKKEKPVGTSSSYNIGISRATWEKLQTIARKTGQSKSAIVSYLVNQAK